MYFYGRTGMTLVWHTANTQTTPLIWIRPCWTPSGNPIYSLRTRKEPISTRSPLITSCYGFSKTATFCIASGKQKIILPKFTDCILQVADGPVGGWHHGFNEWDQSWKTDRQPTDEYTIKDQRKCGWKCNSVDLKVMSPLTETLWGGSSVKYYVG